MNKEEQEKFDNLVNKVEQLQNRIAVLENKLYRHDPAIFEPR